MDRNATRIVLGGAVLCGVLLLGGGCAYFNLFYNAEKAFQEGEYLGRDVDPRERPTSQQRTQYQRAIRKAELLLEEYPDSGHVDDALFLMGKAHLRLENWSDALRNLDNLLANFPNSEFEEEAMYLKGRAYLGRGEEQAGLDWFARLRESYPDGRFAAEAQFRLGDAYVEDGRIARAIEVYEQFLERYPDRPEVSAVRLSLARALIDEDRIEEAIVQLEQIEPDQVNEGELFEAQRLRIESLIEVGRPDEAAPLVATLPELSVDVQQGNEARLLEGKVLIERGRVDEGVALLEELAEDRQGTEAAGEAWYTIIEYYAANEGPDSETLDAKLEVVLEMTLGSVWGPPVRERSNQVIAYDELTATVADADSTAAEERARAAFRLGELLLFGFDDADEAIDWYEQALELGPETDVGPRAAYAIGWIHQEVRDDPAAARVAYDRVRTRYPESVQARAIEGEEFLTPKERTREELEALAQARIRAAGSGETGGLGGADPNDPRFAPLRSLQLGGPGAFMPREREGT